MENREIREQYNAALESMTEKLKKHPKCIAAILYGSTCHDAVWEWSDIQIMAVFNEAYKGRKEFGLLENGIHVGVKIFTLSSFDDYFSTTNVADYLLCALSKSSVLFAKGSAAGAINDIINEALQLGERNREEEMLLGFSEATYYLNKTEKNFYVKENVMNAVFFLPKLVEAIAWIEVAKNRHIPEREIIEQARGGNPLLFEKIYDPIFSMGEHKEVIIDGILRECTRYLTDNVPEAYRSIITYIEKNGSLSGFVMNHRPHGFGVNCDWLVRTGICEVFPGPVTIYNQNDTFFGYNLRQKRSE